DDIPLLIDKFLSDIADEYGAKKKKIASEAIKHLQKFTWSGNIRELRNVIERLVIMSNETISKDEVLKYAQV
ncbi:MAG TPA: hypothetical protein VI583_17510, partial [Cyclobacteriaceae bacterium]|nr:hypothetical protein [Cyclobacteriaceae bacterium]